MLVLKYLFMILGASLFGSAAALVTYDIYLSAQLRRLLGRGTVGEGGAETSLLTPGPFGPVRWGLARRLVASAAGLLLLGLSIVVIPDGSAGVRISQIWGARSGALYPGVHVVTPLIDGLAAYDTREQVYTPSATEVPKSGNEGLTVQAREGLNIGLAVRVRYRWDPQRLTYIHANLPQPVGAEVGAPTVATIYRQIAPNYITREIFATKWEELRTAAAQAITARLGSDRIIVHEVLLRDLKLPEPTPSA
jgi:regulator of protease activity HflC (stomatin/prohibitin superfamily)